MTSAVEKPLSSRTCRQTSVIERTATLNVSPPIILMNGSLSARVSGRFAGWSEPPPGMQMKLEPAPSDRIVVERTPWSDFVALSSVAPAPSPKRTQVARSV